MIRAVSTADAAETETTQPGPAGRGSEAEEEDGAAPGSGNTALAPNDVGSDESELPAEDGAPVGPNEGEEASFLAEQRIASGVASAPGPRTKERSDDPEPAGSLPPLEDLVNRIPAATRALLDELFRAKFVTVKRVPKSALK